MTPPADTAALQRFLRGATARIRVIAAVQGAASALAVAITAVAVTILLGRAPTRLPFIFVAAAVAGAVIAAAISRRRPRDVAAMVEQRAPECRNLVLTGTESLDGHAAITPYVRELVLREAAALCGRLEIATLFPMRNALVALAAVTILAGLISSPAVRHASAARATAVTATAAPAINGITAEVILPPYAGATRRTLHDPVRIEAFAGSTIRLTVEATAKSVSVETLNGRTVLSASSPERFTGDISANSDGFIAIEPTSADGRIGARKLVGISVTADQPPHVRITAPARDLKLPDGKRALDIGVESDDDLGLASLHLRYTKVSGSGERFAFSEGDVPLSITRTDKQHWKAHVTWHLDSLALEPGDMIVYRAMTTDFRPGAPAVESDSYIAEILAPGGVAAAGFALDPEIERYALSEQMVILKTQQLIARRNTIVRDTLTDAAAEIAAEQRRVRAEFVFMMGGEVGGADDGSGDLNEVAETGTGGDLEAARQGRIALMSAIRLMSRADKALSAVDLDAALTQERAALVQLEQTFSHNHIILRALTERERLDMTRRLTGVLTDAVRDVHPVEQPTSDALFVALRRSLADIATLAASGDSSSRAGETTTALAERMLRLDPSSRTLQQVAQSLTDAAAAFARHRVEDAHASLDQAATRLATRLRVGLVDAPLDAPALGASRLAGSMNDAIRRGRGGP